MKFRGHNKRLLMAGAHLTYAPRRNKMVGLVETTLKLHAKNGTLTADSRRLTASNSAQYPHPI
jgi:hypothetical protein